MGSAVVFIDYAIEFIAHVSTNLLQVHGIMNKQGLTRRVGENYVSKEFFCIGCYTVDLFFLESMDYRATSSLCTKTHGRPVGAALLLVVLKFYSGI